MVNGVLYVFCFWWHPLLEGLLSALPLKSKLVSTVLGPWLKLLPADELFMDDAGLSSVV